MASEIRANSITSRAGLSTVTMTDSGPMFSGITTFVDNSTFSVGTGGTIHAPATNTLNIGVNNTESLRIDSNSNLKVAGIVTATHFYGNGANLTSLPAQATISNNADNRVITGGSGVNLNGEANLTFDGSTLGIVGAATLGNGSGLNWGDTSARIRGESGASGLLRFDTNGGERLRIDSNGRLLVGTTSTSASVRAVFQGYHGGGDDYQARVQFQTNQATNLAVNQHLANLLFTNSSGSVGAEIRAIADGSWGTNDYPGRLEFYTTPDGSNTSTERLRITESGKLLLATTDAGYAASYTNMVIGDNSASDSGITIASSTSGIGRIHFADNNNGNAIFAGWIAYNHSSNKMMFSTNESGSEKVTITSGGKVKMVSATANQRGLSVVAPGTQINFGATEDKGGFLLSTTDGQFGLSGGGYWTGSNWVATATASTQIRHDGGTGPMEFCFNTGLTAGNNFTPTTRLEITPSGNMKLSDPGITFSDSSPYFPVAWSGTDGYNTVFTIASTGYANLRFRGEQTTGTEYTMGVGAGLFYMAYDDINNNHRITVAANGVVSLNVNDTSDEKMKKNITSLADGAISRIKQLRPVNFDWKKDSDLNGQSGFIAQEIKTVIPDLVQGEEYVEGNIESVGYSVNTTGIVAHLTKALQEAITKIETLEQDNIALRARVTNLEGN